MPSANLVMSSLGWGAEPPAEGQPRARRSRRHQALHRNGDLTGATDWRKAHCVPPVAREGTPETIDRLVAHVSLAGVGVGIFGGEVFSNKRILPGQPPRLAMSDQWSKRSQVAQVSFDPMGEYFIAASVLLRSGPSGDPLQMPDVADLVREHSASTARRVPEAGSCAPRAGTRARARSSPARKRTSCR